MLQNLLKTRRSMALLAAMIFIFISVVLPLQGIVYAGSDTDLKGAGGLGTDIDSVRDFIDLTPSDFIFTVLNRGRISVEPANPDKIFLQTPQGGSITLGEYFPNEGVILRDDNIDNDLTYRDDKYGLRIDYLNDSGKLESSMNAIEDHLGTVNIGDFSGFEFTWDIKIHDSPEAYAVLDDGGWTNLFNDPHSQTGLRVSNITNKEAFNIQLITTLQDGKVVIQSAEDAGNAVIYSVCNTGLSPVRISQACLRSDSAYIELPIGTTEFTLAETTGIVPATYVSGGNSVPVALYGGQHPLLISASAAIQAVAEVEGLEGGPNCESEGGEYSFLVCPALRFANGAFSTLDTYILRSLDFNEEYLNGADQGVKRAWQNIRNIAYIILIPVMLVMVIGTALNASFVDPYTVKRALPRFFAAVIFMALSYDIARILIELSDGVGRGTAGLIAQPFGGLDNLKLTDIFQASGSEDAIAAFGVGGVIVAGLLGYVTLGIITSLLAVGAATLFLVFLLLTVRELLIIFLIVLAPLAIITWIFKGNDGMWKLWWGTFWKLLMLFPIVMGFLVIGRAFASIVDVAEANSGGSDLYVLVIKLIAFIGPYFAIPSAFKFLGGAFANLAGMANDRSRGFFDRNRQFRQNSRKKATDRAREGNRFRNAPDGGLRSMLNTGAKTGFAAKEIGADPRQWAGRLASAKSDVTMDAGQEFSEKDRAFAAIKDNDTMLLASLHKGKDGKIGSASSIKEYLQSEEGGEMEGDSLKQATGAILRARSGTSFDAYNVAATMALPATGTAWKKIKYDDDGNYVSGGSPEMIKAINAAAGTDDNIRGRMIGGMRPAALKGGRVDLGGAAFGQTWKAAKDQQAGASDFDVHKTIIKSVVDSQGPSAAVYGKPSSVKDVMTEVANSANEIIEGYTTDKVNPETGVKYTFREVAQATASIEGLQSAIAAANPENARTAADALLSVKVNDPTSPTEINMQEFINQSGVRNSPEFAQMVSSFSSTYTQRAMQQQSAIDNMSLAEQQQAAYRRLMENSGQIPPRPGSNRPTDGMF